MSDLSNYDSNSLFLGMLEMSVLLIVVFLRLGVPALAMFWLLRARPAWRRIAAAAACVPLMSIVIPSIMFFLPVHQIDSVVYGKAE